MLILLNEELTMLDVNQSALSFFAVPKEDLLGQNFLPAFFKYQMSTQLTLTTIEKAILTRVSIWDQLKYADSEIKNFLWNFQKLKDGNILVAGLDVEGIENFPSEENVSDCRARILIVEDNALAGRMVKQVFNKLNCVSDIVNSGKSAIQFFKKNHYDIVLMDIGLPEQDGFTITQAIRNLSSNKTSPAIVALTGHVSQEKRQQCLDVGMQEMVEKPITFAIAENLLQQFILYNQHKVTNKVSIDLNEACELASGDEGIARELLAMLVESLPENIREIQMAYSTQDYASLFHIVYKINSGLCYCGVPKLREIVTRFYFSLTNKQIQQIPALIAEFIAEAEQIVLAWQKLAENKLTIEVG